MGWGLGGSTAEKPRSQETVRDASPRSAVQGGCWLSPLRGGYALGPSVLIRGSRVTAGPRFVFSQERTDRDRLGGCKWGRRTESGF